MADDANTPTRYSRSALDGHDKPKCRVIRPPVQGGWSEPAMFEWELTVRVPPNAVGKYSAPRYARLLAIYGPSDGSPSKALAYEKLSR